MRWVDPDGLGGQVDPEGLGGGWIHPPGRWVDPCGLGGGWNPDQASPRWVDPDGLGGGWILMAWEVGGS